MHPRRSAITAILRACVEYNPMFLLSAMALLAGVWLQNPPGGDGGRSTGLVLRLLLTERGYELALLAALLLLRRLTGPAPDLGGAWPVGRERDVRGLGLVLAPFLVDVSRTHALAALLPETWPATIAACALTLLVTAGFAVTAARLIGRRWDLQTWVALLSPAAMALGVPLLASWLTYRGAGADEVTLGAGLGLAAAIGAATLGAGSRDGRVLGAISLVVLALHVLGTAWTHSGALLLAAGPALIALGPALPRLAWPGRADAVTPFVLPIAGALSLGIAGDAAPAAWPLGLAGWASLHALLAWRRRSVPCVLSLLVALDLLAAAPGAGFRFDLGLRHLGTSPLEPAAALALFAWGLARRAHPLALGLPLALAAALTARQRLLGGALDPVLASELLGAGLLAWSHRLHGVAPTRLRWLGVLLLIAPVRLALEAPLGAAPLLLTYAPLLALLLLALATRVRAYAWPLLLVLGEVGRQAAPSAQESWGALAVVLAFLLVGGGVATSVFRERILEWLGPPEPVTP